jgi:hypothetical protein
MKKHFFVISFLLEEDPDVLRVTKAKQILLLFSRKKKAGSNRKWYFKLSKEPHPS